MHGCGVGFLERVTRQVIDAEKAGTDPLDLDLRVPMFRGLMANPIAREFVSDGPMLLIGAGVGIAPFRGFVQKRLRSANCAKKKSGYYKEYGLAPRRVVQRRMGRRRGKSEESGAKPEGRGEVCTGRSTAPARSSVVRYQRVRRTGVCFRGSSKGMGEGVEAALVDVVMDKGNLNREDAQAFWDRKKQAGQYIAVSVVIESIIMEVPLLTSAVGDLVMHTYGFRTTAQ